MACGKFSVAAGISTGEFIAKLRSQNTVELPFFLNI
jgi:hypothetical protein